MDTIDNKTPLQSNTNDLQAQCDALRHLVVSILILVLVISGTLNIYLLRQWRTAKQELTGYRPQATQMISDYHRMTEPLIGDFVEKLKAYGRSHPDFAPILAKYSIKAAAPAAVAPATITPPPPAALPKK